MYFRTKTIKGTPLLQLVESYRNPEGSPRQRVVASLGDTIIPEAEKASIAGAVTRRLRGADSGALGPLTGFGFHRLTHPNQEWEVGVSMFQTEETLSGLEKEVSSGRFLVLRPVRRLLGGLRFSQCSSWWWSPCFIIGARWVESAFVRA